MQQLTVVTNDKDQLNYLCNSYAKQLANNILTEYNNDMSEEDVNKLILQLESILHSTVVDKNTFTVTVPSSTNN